MHAGTQQQEMRCLLAEDRHERASSPYTSRVFLPPRVFQPGLPRSHAGSNNIFRMLKRHIPGRELLTTGSPGAIEIGDGEPVIRQRGGHTLVNVVRYDSELIFLHRADMYIGKSR